MSLIRADIELALELADIDYADWMYLDQESTAWNALKMGTYDFHKTVWNYSYLTGCDN